MSSAGSRKAPPSLGAIVRPLARHEIEPGVWLCWDAKVELNEHGGRLRAALWARGEELVARLRAELVGGGTDATA